MFLDFANISVIKGNIDEERKVLWKIAVILIVYVFYYLISNQDRKRILHVPTDYFRLLIVSVPNFV